MLFSSKYDFDKFWGKWDTIKGLGMRQEVLQLKHQTGTRETWNLFQDWIYVFHTTSSKFLGHPSKSQMADNCFHQFLGALGTNIYLGNRV